jgi:dTDP-glucose 4,6-dehydratase
MRNIVVTGGLGFIGSHFIRQILSNKDSDIRSVTNIDFMGYGSNLLNLKGLTDARYKYIKNNIADKNKIESELMTKDIDTVVNFAAETHVDRSISNPTDFIDSNINGVISLLEFCRIHDVELFVQISTDEVYGDSIGGENFIESSPLRPNNPYSASKASADLLTSAYNKTYGIKTIITRCSNNYGPNQFPEKLIPKTTIRILKGLPVPLYGDGKQTREWIYVKDHVNAINMIINNSRIGEIYNISSSNLISNIELITAIGEIIKKYNPNLNLRIEHVEDRPGHDKRYSLDTSKIRQKLGWKPVYSFESSLEETIRWFINNEWWWAPLLNSNVLDMQPWKSNWKRNNQKEY